MKCAATLIISKIKLQLNSNAIYKEDIYVYYVLINWVWHIHNSIYDSSFLIKYLFCNTYKELKTF